MQPKAAVGGNGGNTVAVVSSLSGSNMKSPRALGGVVTTGSAGPSDAITRGEADGSPAPLSTDSAAGPGSETPSLTSPTSTTSTTSLSSHPQPGRRGMSNKDYDSEDDEQDHPAHGMANTNGSSRRASHRDESARVVVTGPDDTDQGESDLESPN